MYIAITKQQMGSTYGSSVADYVDYLKKEDAERAPEEREHFFNHYNDQVDANRVISEIDGNTAKLKKKDPKFYSIIVNPTQRELQAIGNDPSRLREYVRELMKDYAESFNRYRTVSVDEIMYFAKIEHERTFREFDKKVKENQVYTKQITALKNELRKVEKGEIKGSIKKIEKRILNLTAQIPHRIDGEVLTAGMKKPGFQTHVHIIVSRKDVTDTYSLSPGSLYKASEAELNGKIVKRGFDRNRFFEKAEKTFDKVSGFNRNYVESYSGKKTRSRNQKLFYLKLMGMPTSEQALAHKLLRRSNINVPVIPTNNVQLALRAFSKLKRGLEVAVRSSSIGV